jgi:hypothetical protein
MHAVRAFAAAAMTSGSGEKWSFRFGYLLNQLPFVFSFDRRRRRRRP